MYICPEFKNVVMSRDERNKLKYTIALVAEFANKFGVGEKQAYNYLSRFKGLAHLSAYYDVIHTLSFEDAVDTMTQICAHNGGGLK